MMKALFPGSFDPITNGHLEIIKRASHCFDEVEVAIMTNPNKSAWWSAKERQNMVEEVIADLDNVSVAIYTNALAMDIAKKQNAVLIKSVRDAKDFDYEYPQARINYEAGGVETLFLMAQPPFDMISSTLVKELAMFGEAYARYVPANVKEQLEKKVGGQYE